MSAAPGAVEQAAAQHIRRARELAAEAEAWGILQPHFSLGMRARYSEADKVTEMQRWIWVQVGIAQHEYGQRDGAREQAATPKSPGMSRSTTRAFMRGPMGRQHTQRNPPPQDGGKAQKRRELCPQRQTER